MDFLDEVLSYSKKQTSQVRDVVTELITFDNTQRRLEQAELRAYEFDLNQVYAVWSTSIMFSLKADSDLIVNVNY